MIQRIHKIGCLCIKWIIVFCLSLLLLSSCKSWRGVVSENSVQEKSVFEKKDHIQEDHWQLSESIDMTPDDDNIPMDEKNIEKSGDSFTLESGSSKLFKHKLTDYLDKRIRLFEQTFPAIAGIILFNVNTRTEMVSYHADECFIPASLTKIVLCSAFIQLLRETNPDIDISDSFEKEKTSIQWQKQAFTNLSHLFRQINHYTFQEAPRANRTAVLLGEFLQLHNQYIHDTYQSLENILLSHLDQISFLSSCNRIDNASGLTLNNRLTPFQIADSMFHVNDIPIYQKSFMHGGEGTLRNRLKNIGPMHFFKTGSLKRSGVLCLAAFLDLIEPIGLVIMINQLPSNQFSDATLWIDETILGMVAFDI